MAQRRHGGNWNLHPVRDLDAQRLRLEEMQINRRAGLTLEEIAEIHGVSRERVRQIFKAGGVPVSREVGYRWR